MLEEGFGLKEFTCSVIELQKEYAEQGQIVYAYNFNHRSQENPWPEYMGQLMLFNIGLARLSLVGAPLLWEILDPPLETSAKQLHWHTSHSATAILKENVHFSCFRTG